VSISSDGVIVNGTQLSEYYVPSDLRMWGLIPVESIIGKAVYKYWPPSHWARSATKLWQLHRIIGHLGNEDTVFSAAISMSAHK